MLTTYIIAIIAIFAMLTLWITVDKWAMKVPALQCDETPEGDACHHCVMNDACNKEEPTE